MDEYSKYNDNELIYLIRSGNEKAYAFLIKKYEKYIYRRISEMHLIEKEDVFQECILVLYIAARGFSDNYNKSFMKYFEQLLNHKLLDIKKSQRKLDDVMYSSYLEMDNYHLVKEDSLSLNKDFIVNKSILSKLTDIERNIYEDYFVNNMAINDIALKHNLDRKIIYHTIYRIKRKIKKYMVK